MSEDIAAQTVALIAGHLETDAGKISRETNLDELGIDSMKLTEIVMDLEDHFDIEIDLNAAESWEAYKKVGNIIDAIAALDAAKST